MRRFLAGWTCCGGGDPLAHEIHRARRRYLKQEQERAIEVFRVALDNVQTWPSTYDLDVSALSENGRGYLATMLHGGWIEFACNPPATEMPLPTLDDSTTFPLFFTTAVYEDPGTASRLQWRIWRD